MTVDWIGADMLCAFRHRRGAKLVFAPSSVVLIREIPRGWGHDLKCGETPQFTSPV